MKASSGQDRHIRRLEHEGTLVDVARQEGLVLDPVAAGALDHDRVFEDTFEAIVGAVYLDRGWMRQKDSCRSNRHEYRSRDRENQITDIIKAWTSTKPYHDTSRKITMG